MRKFINSMQNYAWESKITLTELYGIANLTQQPMAKLWVGVHPESNSQVLGADGQTVALCDVIKHDKSALLGEAAAQRSGELSFLFKILCATQPLPIQVHPNKHNPEIGLVRENAAGILMDTVERNYKDSNHKSELIFALTPFLAMNALHEFSDTVAPLQPVSVTRPAIVHFLEEPNTECLSYLFAGSLNIQDEEEPHALAILKPALNSQQDESQQTIRLIIDIHPSDSGLFSPLLFNVVELNPGETMFLFAKTPHAYLQGAALEAMANSDNVLHTGLTPRYIDIPELVANVRFVVEPVNRLLTTPVKSDGEPDLPILINDSAFSLHEFTTSGADISQQSAAILLRIEGETVLSKGGQHLILRPGRSAFIGANESPVNISGVGHLTRVYNRLQQGTDIFSNSC